MSHLIKISSYRRLNLCVIFHLHVTTVTGDRWVGPMGESCDLIGQQSQLSRVSEKITHKYNFRYFAHFFNVVRSIL
jgi:hypothetical protein